MAQTFITSTTELPRNRVPKFWSQGLDPGAEVLMYEDWIGANPDTNTRVGNNFWQMSTSGGSVAPATGEAFAFGVLQLSITNGRASVYQSLDGILLGGADITCVMRVKIPTLATAAQAFRAIFGLGDTSDASLSVDGVFFQHDETTGNWLCKCRSNSSETSVTTTTAISAGSWATIKFVINAAATSVKFYIGTNSTNMTLAATITTNIPSGAGRNCGPLMKAIKTKGNTTRTVLNDYYIMNAIISGGR